MTLAELLPAVQQLSAADKVKLIRILAEELDTDSDFLPLAPHRVYPLATPYSSFGAGRILMEAMRDNSRDVD